MAAIAALALLLATPAAMPCAALAPDALAVFQRPGVPDALFAKIKHGVPLTLDDVIILSRADVSHGAIVYYLYSFGRHFYLTPADVAELRRDYVTTDIIDYMQSASSHPSVFDF